MQMPSALPAQVHCTGIQSFCVVSSQESGSHDAQEPSYIKIYMLDMNGKICIIIASKRTKQVLGLAIFCLLVIIKSGHVTLVYDDYTKDTDEDISKNATELKYILYWNEAYGSKEYGFCCGQGR